MAAKAIDGMEDRNAEEIDRSVFRHQRRVRNTVIVFLITLIIVLILSAGISFGVNRVIDRIGTLSRVGTTGDSASDEGSLVNTSDPVSIGEPETESAADIVGDLDADNADTSETEQ